MVRVMALEERVETVILVYANQYGSYTGPVLTLYITFYGQITFIIHSSVFTGHNFK